MSQFYFVKAITNFLFQSSQGNCALNLVTLASTFPVTSTSKNLSDLKDV